MSRFRSAIAVAALVAATAASAAVYRPSFDGPDLDPSLTFSGNPGISFSNSFGTLGIFKAGGVTKANSIFVSSFAVTGDFDARLTLSNANNLGSSRFFFAADLQSNPALALGFVSRDSDIFAPLGLHRFGGKPVQPGNFSGGIDLAENVVVLRLRRSNGVSEAFVGDHLLRSVFVGDTALPPITFNFGLINQGLQSDLDPADRAAFVSDFVVRTPGVPEPAGWTLLIAGFGLTGAVMRRRPMITA